MSLSAKLSTVGVRSLREEVARRRDALPSLCDELCRRLAEEGVATAVALAPVDTGALRAGIHLAVRGDRSYLVVADAAHAAFVEFGTGVVGEGTYPGEVPEGWEYLRDPPRSPWAHDADDVSTWHYLGMDGAFHATRGQEASCYMGGAAEELRQRVAAVAREVVSRW